MKFIYYTNNIFFGATLLGYLTVFLGLMLQVALGGIQVLLFLVLLFSYHKFSKKMRQHLLIYGICTTIFLFFFFIYNKEFSNGLLALILFPMSLATYFTYIVYQLKQQIS